MKISIHQPNYLPWSGYFAKMNNSDIFVILDDVEVSPGQSYVYRTKILTKNGPIWLSIPCHRHQLSLIKDVQIVQDNWNKKHLRSIVEAYGKTPFFNEFFPIIEPYFLNPISNLANHNLKLIIKIAEFLEINCQILLSSKIPHEGVGDDRLLSIVKNLGGSIYISGKGGKNYQDPKKFEKSGIELRVMEYTPIKYSQIKEGFFSGLSIIDAVFSLGKATVKILHY